METRAALCAPMARGLFVAGRLRASAGTAVAVPEGELEPMQRAIGALGGGYISLETAAAFAALELLAGRGDVGRDERVVVFDTGAGFKSEPPLELSQRMAEVYRAQMREVGCLDPNHEPKVSDHLEQIFTLVTTLLERGNAYVLQRGAGRRPDLDRRVPGAL